MAVTKLWHIRGSIKDLIDYVENPGKTVLRDSKTQDFFNVFSYARNPDKTADEQYVTAINCQKDVALRQMILTKKQYGKEDGYIAWHGYQSFKPGEITPDGCHTLGVMLAKEMWGDRFRSSSPPIWTEGICITILRLTPCPSGTVGNIISPRRSGRECGTFPIGSAGPSACP